MTKSTWELKKQDSLVFCVSYHSTPANLLEIALTGSKLQVSDSSCYHFVNCVTPKSPQY